LAKELSGGRASGSVRSDGNSFPWLVIKNYNL
jgi:hypothetical protein